MEQDEDENAADTGKYPFKCGTVTFTEKPVYGMVEVARLQELADAVADHARVCKSRVLVTNTTRLIDVEVQLESDALCVDFSAKKAEHA